MNDFTPTSKRESGSAAIVDHDALRSEWEFRKQRIDSLHDEAWAIQTRQHERMTEIWLEVQRHRARIAEIVALGVDFDA